MKEQLWDLTQNRLSVNQPYQITGMQMCSLGMFYPSIHSIGFAYPLTPLSITTGGITTFTLETRKSTKDSGHPETLLNDRSADTVLTETSFLTAVHYLPGSKGTLPNSKAYR